MKPQSINLQKIRIMFCGAFRNNVDEKSRQGVAGCNSWNTLTFIEGNVRKVSHD